MESSTQLQQHLISLYTDYNLLLAFGHAHELLTDIYFIDKLDELRKRHCDRCSITFESSEARNQHYQDKHTEKKIWNCHVCAKGFAQKRYLNAHLKTHATIKRCELCNFMTNNRVALSIHKKSCVIHCAYCNQQFTSEKALCRHEDFMHKQVKCELCNKVIGCERNLIKHKLLKHKEKDSKVSILFSCKVRLNLI